MPEITEGVYSAEFLISEGPGTRSREIGTVKQGENLKSGHVLGASQFGATVTVTPNGRNTGDGTLTMGAADLGAASVVGVYAVECIEAAANGGRFSVTTPDGDALEEAVVGTAYSNDHLGFTIADGAADFVVGDSFTLTVAVGDGKLEELDVAVNTGAQIAYGILLDNVDASATGTNADTAASYIRRDAEVKADKLTWPSGITVEQQALATTQLAEQGIIIRT